MCLMGDVTITFLFDHTPNMDTTPFLPGLCINLFFFKINIPIGKRKKTVVYNKLKEQNPKGEQIIP